MPAYTIHGGPCHYDIQLCYYLFLSSRYVRNNVHNPNNNNGRRWINRTSRRQRNRLIKQFHKFFNPDLRNGEWKLYEFDPCCSFHMDIAIHLPPAGWAGLNETQVRQRLPAGCGMIVVDDLGITEHPHASIGGLRLLVDRQGGRNTFAHEVGHNLGLPDDYRTPDIPDLGVVGNGMTAEEERRHRGHLMGKKRRGRREIQGHEIENIAQSTGMTCDEDVCCPGKKKARDQKTGGKDEKADTHDHTDDNLMVPGAPSSFGAHAGAEAPFDLAAELIGQIRLDKILKKQKRKLRKKN